MTAHQTRAFAPDQAFAGHGGPFRDSVPATGSALRQWGHRAVKAVGAAAGALLLAACQVIPQGAEGPPPAPTQPTAPAPVPTTPNGPVLPVDQGRHRVALLVPQSGANSDVGNAIANATTLALLDSKSDKVRITTYDTAKGAAAAARAALADGNMLILGPLLSEDVTQVAPLARNAGVPVISFSNDASVAGNGIYIMGFVPGQAVERVVGHARARGMTRFAALTPKSTYGDRALTALRSAVAAQGGTLVAAQSYDRTASGLTLATRRLAQDGAYDALLIADSGGTAIRAVPLVRSSGSTAQILGTELWNTDASLASTAAMRGAWFASVSDGLYGQMATKYRTQFGRAPFRLSSLGYDAVLLTLLGNARGWRPGTPYPATILQSRDGFGGIDGIFRFNANGVALRALEVSEVRSGGFAVIDPAPKKW